MKMNKFFFVSLLVVYACIVNGQPCIPSDVDAGCGGNCTTKCLERSKCTVDADCASGAVCAPFNAALNITVCFFPDVAEASIPVFMFYMIGTSIMLSLCVFAECRSRVKNKLSARSRRLQKQVAERKRQAKIREEKDFEEQEAERKKKEAYMIRLAEKLAEESSDEDDESSDDEDLIPVQKKRGTGLIKMVSTMLPSSRARSKTSSALTGQSKWDLEGARKASVDEDPEEKKARRKKKKQAKKLAILANAAQSPEEEATRQRMLHLPALKELNEKSKKHVTQLRKDAAIVNVNTQILKKELTSATTKLRIIVLCLLKPGTMVNLSSDEVEHCVMETQRAESLVADVMGNRGGDQNKNGNMLLNAVTAIEEAGELLSSPIDGDYFGKATECLDWELGDHDMQKLQHEVDLEMASKSEKKKQMKEKVMLANTSFVSAANVTDLAKARKKEWHRTLLRPLYRLVPGVFLVYPAFYTAFFAGLIAVVLPIAVQIGRAQSNIELQNSPLLGSTFLPVPPYYNLDDHELQRTTVPLIYTVMHCALYCFCWIPVPFWRGIWRDVSLNYPKARRFFPIDDMVFFHKFLALIVLTMLFVGGILFMVSLAARCQDKDYRSCIAFDQFAPPDNAEVQFNELEVSTFAFNPFLNVLMLRKIVYTLWFPIFPLLHWARGAPPKWLPSFVKRYFYEIAYYGHHFVAHVSFVTAMISRFDVFYPALFTWGIYYLDNIREMLTKSYSTTIVIRPQYASQEDDQDDATSLIHTDVTGKPTSMKIRMTVPAGFKINAGQFVYVKVPSISKVQWHPFSLASGSKDDYIELQVGVIGDKAIWKQDKESGEWGQIARPTFTYQLQREMRNRIMQMAMLDDPERQADTVAPLRCKLRGPYGSTFTKCFDPRYQGTVIIGAGTGLTAALSVLRELITRKRAGERVPKYCWFVWSCSRVSDLLWVWDTLHELILSAVKDETLKPGKKWSRASNMLGWLSVTLYISRSKPGQIENFLESKIKASSYVQGMDQKSREKAKAKAEEDPKMPAPGEKRTKHIAQLRDLWVSTNTTIRRNALSQEIHHWLGHERHLLKASVDDEAVHVKKLLAWARVYMDRKAGVDSKMTVAFCGPTTLAHLLNQASADLGSGMQFSADHQ